MIEFGEQAGHGSPGLSVPALRALRIAATLASVARDVRVRIGNGERTTVEVRRPPFDGGLVDSDPDRIVVPPCHFRVAVAKAYAQHVGGQPVAMTGVDDMSDPVIEVGLPPSDAVLPGDIYRLHNDDEWTFLFATDLDLEHAIAAGAELDEAHKSECGRLVVDDGCSGDSASRVVKVAFHYDDLTDITLVHTSVPELDLASADAHVTALQRLLARCAIEELMGELVS